MLKLGQLISGKSLKLLQPDVIFWNWNASNSISAGAVPENPLGSLQRSPDFLAGFEGPTSKGAETKGKEGRAVFSVQFVGNPKRRKYESW